MKKYTNAEKKQIYLHFKRKITLYYIRNNYYSPHISENMAAYLNHDVLKRTKSAFQNYITKREMGGEPNDIIIESLSILFKNLKQDETTFFRD